MTDSAANKIMAGLRDAIAGNFSRVTIEGQTWVRTDNLSKEIDPKLIAALALTHPNVQHAVESPMSAVNAILDEIEVGPDNKCHWTEIANAQSKIKAALRSAIFPPQEGPRQGVYGEMCIDPKICAGKGYCPRDPSCCE